MAKYRKKPIVVESFQMTKEHRWDNSEWPEWLNKAWNKELSEGALWVGNFPDSEGTYRLCIGTLEGVHVVDYGDWIIQGVKGELYPCKPDIFEQTYELVE